MKRAAFYILLFGLAAGCTEKGKPYQQHEAARHAAEGPVAGTEPSAGQQAADMAALSKLSLNELAARVLDPARVRDPKSLLSRQVQDELNLLNRMILNAPNRPEVAPILERYEQALMTECGAFVDSCMGLRYFDRSAPSSQVAKLIAKRKPGSHFKMILMALKLKSLDWDPELAEMLLDKPAGPLSAEEQKFEDAGRSMMETALLSVQQHTKDPAETRRLLEKVDAWKMISSPQMRLSAGLASALTAMMNTAGFLYEGEKLHPGLRAAIERQKLEESGIQSRRERLKRRPEFSAESLGVDLGMGASDELTYLLDAVYTGTLPTDAAVRLFAGSKRSADDLDRATAAYLRLQFLSALLESTDMATKIFNAKVPLDGLLWYAIKESAAIQRVWSTFNSAVLPLRNFALLAAAQRPEAERHQKRLRDLFESIGKSITITSVYPHEMVLFHMLSRKRFEITLPSGRKIDTGDIMRMLFEGNLDPLLTYSDTTAHLNQFELLHAFDSAVRTGLVRTAGIDPDEFIAETVHALSATPVSKVETNLGAIATRLNQTPYYPAFKNACEEFRTGIPVARTFYFPELEHAAYYGNLIRVAFTSVAGLNTSTNDGLEIQVPGLMYLDSAHSEAIEIARLDLGNLIRIGRAMLASYESTLQKTGQAATIAGKTKQARAEIARLENLRAKTLRLSKQWLDDIGKCFFPAMSREYAVRAQLIEAEKAYLRSVYRKIKRLQDPATSRSEKSAIMAGVRLSGLPSGFQGLDQITESGYRYSQIDAMVRMASYMKNGLHTETDSMAPIAPNVTVDFGNKLDLDVKLVRESLQTTLTAEGSEDEFVGSALQTLFAPRGAFFHWYADGGALTTWEEAIKAFASLNRLEYEMNGQATQIRPVELLETQESVLKLTRITPQDRELMTLLKTPVKYDPLYWDYRTLRYSIAEGRILQFWGIFDLPVRLMNEEVLGDYQNAIRNDGGAALLPLRQTFITAGRAYFTSRAPSYRGLTVLPYNPELDRHLDQSIRAFIGAELHAAEDFSKALKTYVAQVQAKPAADRPRVDVDLYQSFSSPLVDDNLLSTYAAKVQRFHQTTHSCFVPGKTCPDFNSEGTDGVYMVDKQPVPAKDL